MSCEQTTLPFDSGRIENLFRKERHGKDNIALSQGEALECFTGFGIQGDVHANRLSPRQILITLQSELDGLSIAAGALHENVVISSRFAELFRPGTALITERGVEIRLTMFCEPCKRILSVAPDLRAMINRRGTLGYIERGGKIGVDDRFTFLPGRYTALPESAYQRFLEFVPKIPPGKVVRYSDVTTAIGVADSFVRALPGYIKRSVGFDIPLHRIVSAEGWLPNYVAAQAEKLIAEGIQVKFPNEMLGRVRGKTELQQHLWHG